MIESDPGQGTFQSLPGQPSGVDNPLFCKDNDRMLFGDARKMLDEVPVSLKNGARLRGGTARIPLGDSNPLDRPRI